MSRAAWASSTTATILSICAAAMARPTSTAPTSQLQLCLPDFRSLPRTHARRQGARRMVAERRRHLQSGQPYSVIDYSGAVGSIFYSTFPTASPTPSFRWLQAALDGAIPTNDPFETGLHHRPAQHLPPVLASAAWTSPSSSSPNLTSASSSDIPSTYSTSSTPPASTSPSTTSRKTSITMASRWPGPFLFYQRCCNSSPDNNANRLLQLPARPRQRQQNHRQRPPDPNVV
jgi:hypothetical protein